MKLDKRERNKKYKEALVVLEKVIEIKVGCTGLCILLGNTLSKGFMDTPNFVIKDSFPEFVLFCESWSDDFLPRFQEELTDEIREVILKLCIAMTE